MDSKLVSITIASLWLIFDTFWLDTFLRKKSYKKNIKSYKLIVITKILKNLKNDRLRQFLSKRKRVFLHNMRYSKDSV